MGVQGRVYSGIADAAKPWSTVPKCLVRSLRGISVEALYVRCLAIAGGARSCPPAKHVTTTQIYHSKGIHVRLYRFIFVVGSPHAVSLTLIGRNRRTLSQAGHNCKSLSSQANPAQCGDVSLSDAKSQS